MAVGMLPVFLFAVLLLGEGASGLTLRSSGSSLVSSLISQWASTFALSVGGQASISFRPTTSLQGIDDVSNRKMDFAFTSVPVTEDVYTAQVDLQMIPVVAIPLVFSYNLPGIEGTLTLTRSLLVDIYAGSVDTWNHPALQAVNPTLALPNATIQVLVRQGDSGSTQVLTSALTTFSADWDYRFGVFTTSAGFNGSTARLVECASDQAMAAMVTSQPFVLGYLPLSVAVGQSLEFARVVNLMGTSTFPIPSVVQTGLESAVYDARLVTSGVDLSGLNSYPVVSVSYVLLRLRSMADCSAALYLSDFLQWVLENNAADRLALDLGYIPMPSMVNSLVWPKLLDIRCDGKPIRGEVLVSAAGSVQAGTLMYALNSEYTKTHSTVAMTYVEVSSSEAIREITYFEADLVLSDIALQDADYAATADQPLQMVPLLASAVALVVNLPGLSSEVVLTMSREVLAGVFNGSVLWWDYPELRRLNPFVYLPHRPIVLVTISQSSAVTLLLQTALSRFAPDWVGQYNVSSNPTWPPAVAATMLLAPTHDAVMALVQRTRYSIGAVPYASAALAGATMVALVNQAGNVVLPAQDTIGAAAEGALFTNRFTSDLIDTTGETSYPIVGFTSFVLRQDVLAADCRVADAIVNFVQWVTGSAEALSVTRANGYVPAFSTPSDKVAAVLQQFTCNGRLVIPPPVPFRLDVIPIVIPVVVGMVAIGLVVAYLFWKIHARLKFVQAKLNDARVAVELSDAIATFDLEKMAFLETVERPTTTQQSCIRILRSLKQVKRYIPQAVLTQLQGDDDGEDDDNEEKDLHPSGKEDEQITLSVDGKPPNPRRVSSHLRGGGSSTGTGGVRVRATTTTVTSSSGRTSTSSSMVSGTKAVRRAITAMYFCITNFNELLREDSTTAVRTYNSFVEKAFEMVNAHSGTVASIDGENLLVHWNAAKRCSSARMQACQLAVKLHHAAVETKLF
eukprot:RCo052836